MISLTPEAQKQAQDLLASTGEPAGGLRIGWPEAQAATQPATQPEREIDVLDVQVAGRPEPNDVVQDAGTVRLFLDRQVEAAFRGGHVDVDNGEFVLVPPAERTPAPAAPGPLGSRRWTGRVLLANTDRALPGELEQMLHAHRIRRPIWFVGLVTFATAFVGMPIYLLVWLGMTWAELKAERDDPTMHPWWHALTPFVPVYGYFRLHAHFRTIEEVHQGWATKLRSFALPDVAPGRAVIGMIVANALPVLGHRLERHGVGGAWTLALDVAGALLAALVVAHGQRCLNALWDVADGRSEPGRTHWAAWLLLVIASIAALLVILDTVAEAAGA